MKINYFTSVVTGILFLFLSVLPSNATSVLDGTTLTSFFWFYNANDSLKNGCFGYLQIDSSSTVANQYSSTFWLQKYSWWHKKFSDTYLPIAITTTNKKPDAVIAAPNHYSSIEWLTGFECKDQKDTLQFYFPLLPQSRAYGRYDYFTIEVNNTTNLEFYGVGDDIMIGSFVHKEPTSSGTVNLLGRNAFIIELTDANPLRIKSIRCNGAYKTLLTDFLHLNLDLFKKDAAWYGIDITDTTANVPKIAVHSIEINGTSPFMSSTLHKITWKLESPKEVDSCLVNASFDNKKTWKRSGKTGPDSSFIWTVPNQTSDSVFIKVTAFGKYGEKISALSKQITTEISPNFILSVQSNSDNSIIATWNPDALTIPGKKEFCLAYRNGSVVKSIDEDVDTLIFDLIANTTTIPSLTSAGTYYFTAFVIDSSGKYIKANGVAIDSAVAKDLTPPKNNYRLYGESLDSATIAITWKIARNAMDSDIKKIGIWYNEFNYPVAANFKDSINAIIWDATDDTTAITKFYQLDPDKLYYFALFVADENDNWSTAPSAAQVQIRTKPPGGKINGTEVTITDTNVSASGTDKQSLILDSLNLWIEGLNTPYIDTIDRWAPPSTGGFIVCGPVFSFRHGKAPTGMNISFSVKYSLPESGNYSEKDILVYRYNIYTAAWRRETSVLTYDTDQKNVNFSIDDIRHPIALMIDIETPRIGNYEIDTTAYSVADPIIDNFFVHDNIENPAVSLLAAPGSMAYSDISLYITPGRKSSDYISTIPAYVASERSGLRSLIIVHDGRNSDTINLSRRIIRNEDNYDDCTIPTMQWTPLSVTADPANNTFGAVLAASHGTNEFEYDNRKERILQWLPTKDNQSLPDRWVEYNDNDNLDFTFSLGKLYWIKTKSEIPIKFGHAVIPTLIDTFEIALKKGEWTEFGMPYNFDVYVYDIITATSENANVDKIEFYEWTKSNDIYTTNAICLPGINDACDSKSVFKAGEAYTAFNNEDTDIILRIPPVCTQLSAINLTDRKSLGKNVASSQQWSVKLTSNDKNGSVLSPIFCAAVPKDGQPRLYHAAPTLASVSVKIIEPTTGKHFGHAANGDLSDGGETFILSFENKADKTATITTTIEQIIGLPEGVHALLYSKTNTRITYPSASLITSLSPGQNRTGYLVVGSAAFVDGFIKNINSAFSFFPFTFNHGLKIHYTLPIGVEKLEISLFDLKGRRIQKILKYTNLLAGEGSLVIDQKFTAGYYIIQLKAEMIGTHNPMIMNKRWLYVQ